MILAAVASRAAPAVRCGLGWVAGFRHHGRSGSALGSEGVEKGREKGGNKNPVVVQIVACLSS